MTLLTLSMRIVARSNPLNPCSPEPNASTVAPSFRRLAIHNVTGKSAMAIQSVAAVKERSILMIADNLWGTLLRGAGSRAGLKKLIPFIKSRSPSA
jgi:hypothetical protein